MRTSFCTSLASQAVLLIVLHPSAVLPGIRSFFFLDLQSNLMSLLSYFHGHCTSGPARSCGTPIVGAIAFKHRRGQRCCERRAATKETTELRSEGCTSSTPPEIDCEHCIIILNVRYSGVVCSFEIHPLPDEQSALWAKFLY